MTAQVHRGRSHLSNGMASVVQAAHVGEQSDQWHAAADMGPEQCATQAGHPGAEQQ